MNLTSASLVLKKQTLVCEKKVVPSDLKIPISFLLENQ
jgi:hypothetical protein